MAKEGDHRDFAAILAKRGFAGINKIGEGSFGVAVLVEDKDGTKAVCKMVDVSRASPKEVREAKREGRLLARLKHQYIVRYMDSFSDRGWLGILMEYADGGDLTAEIERAKSAKASISEEWIVRWFSQCMLAIQYLHSNHILHRDLKPSNLFLTEDRNLRVGDFGVSKAMACTAEFAHTMIGTPYYISPEVVKEKPYSWPADIWAMGCILYQMCALRVPFEARDMGQLIQKITKTKPPDVPNTFSEPIREMVAQMLNRSASARPTADQVLETPMVRNFIAKLREESAPEEKSALAKEVSRYEIMDRFRLFDINGDGVIDREEFGRMLKHMDASTWTNERIDHMLRLADTNGDGKIQFDEFVHWIFGNDDGVGLASRSQQMIELAHKAASHGDLVLLEKSLVKWRQAIDIGYLHVSPPEVTAQTCESLAWLALNNSSLLESTSNTADAGTAMNIAKQMNAILHHVDQLLVEYSQPCVRRVLGIASRTLVRGLAFELVDGLRLGECPSGLSDESLFSAGGRWQTLSEGEHIVEVKGVGCQPSAPSAAPKAKAGRRPSPPPGRGRSPSLSLESEECLAAGVVVCTNAGREFSFGKGLTDGVLFSFKAGSGTEIIEANFNSGSCVGIRTAPRKVDWPRDKAEEVRSAFQLAAESVCNNLLVLSWKAGPKYGMHAQLQARRMGIKSNHLYIPDDVKERRNSLEVDMEQLSHWEVPAKGSGMKIIPSDSAILADLGAKEVRALQELVSATHARQCSRPSKAKVPDGMTVIRAARFQSPVAWRNFMSRRESIREDLEIFRESGASLLQPDLLTDSHLFLTGAHDRLTKSFFGVNAGGEDSEDNCCWLFHGLSSVAAERILDSDFAIDRTGAEDGRLYGDGVYFTEYCSRADELTLGDADAEGLRCLLLCRCVLGNILTSDELFPDVVNLVAQCVGGSHHSVMGDRRKRSPNSFREFVVYDADQVYPEIVIWYRRLYQR